MATPTHGIPASARELNAEWLTLALQQARVINDQTAVASARVNELTATSGQSGWYALVEADYTVSSDDLPRRLFAKVLVLTPRLSSDLPLLFFRQEIAFYSQVAPKTRTRVPRYYLGEIDEGSRSAIILMEALDSSSCASTVAGLSEQDTDLVLRELALLHARWWKSDEPGDLLGLHDMFSIALAEHYMLLYPKVWPQLGELISSEVGDYALDLGDRLMGCYARLLEDLDRLPKTFIHLDCRPDNVAFEGMSAARRAVLFDWSIGTRGPAVADLATLVLTSLEGVRCAQVAGMLARYHERLVDLGVHDYSLAQLEEDFRLAAVCAFIGRVAALRSLRSVDDQHPIEQMRLAGFRRIAAAVEELDCRDLVQIESVGG